MMNGIVFHDDYDKYDLGMIHPLIGDKPRRTLENLKKNIHNPKKHINPGVLELLDALESLDEFWLGLLTGNIEQGARIKLDAFGLNKYFPVGAFSDDSEDRNRLLPIAVERINKMVNINFSYRECIVIGDTALDVACAKPFGATSIAVATGPYSYESLLKSGADYTVKDLVGAIKIFNNL